MASKKEHLRKKKAKRHPGKEEENPYSEIASGVEINSLNLLSVFHGIRQHNKKDEVDEEAAAGVPEASAESGDRPDAAAQRDPEPPENPPAEQDSAATDEGQTGRTQFTIVLHKAAEEANRNKWAEEEEERERKKIAERERRRQLLLKVQQMQALADRSDDSANSDEPDKPEKDGDSVNDSLPIPTPAAATETPVAEDAQPDADARLRTILDTDRAMKEEKAKKREREAAEAAEQVRALAAEHERRRQWAEKAEQLRLAAEKAEGAGADTGASDEIRQLLAEKKRRKYEDQEVSGTREEAGSEASRATPEATGEADVAPAGGLDQKWREVVEADKALIAAEEAKRRQDMADAAERERQKAEERERRRIWLEKAEEMRRIGECPTSDEAGGQTTPEEEAADAVPPAEFRDASLKGGEESETEAEVQRQRRAILDTQQAMREAKEKKRQQAAADAAEQLKALAEEQERRRQWAEKAEQLRLAAERADSGGVGEEVPEEVRSLLAEKKRMITGEKEMADTRLAVEGQVPGASVGAGEVPVTETGQTSDPEGTTVSFGASTVALHKLAEQAKRARLEAEEADRARKKAGEQERRRQLLAIAQQARKREEEEKESSGLEQGEAERARLVEAAAEEARRRAEAEEIRRREAEEAERRRLEAEEAERRRREEEEAELARKRAEEAERRREEEEEAERLRLKAEEAERLRRAAEEERLRLEAIEAERLRREAEEKELARRRAEAEERRRKEEEEARLAEEAERRRREEEAAELARREAEEAERRRREEEEAERLRREAIEAERLRREAEEAELERRRLEAEERRRREEEAAERARLEAEEEERRRRAEEEAERARREALEAEERRVAEEKAREEERLRLEAIEAERKRQEAEAAELARRRAVEEELRRQEEAAEAARLEREAEEARERARLAEEVERARREAEEQAERRQREAAEALRAQQQAEEAERLRQEEEAAERARRMAEAVDRAKRAAAEAERSRRGVETAEGRHRETVLEELRRREEETMRQAREMAEEAERMRRPTAKPASSEPAKDAVGASQTVPAPVLEVDNPYWETPREIFETLSGAPQGAGLPSYARVENEGTLPVTMPGGNGQPDAAPRYTSDPVFGEGGEPAHGHETTAPVPLEKRMYIVMVTPEVAPCAKVGGLGDVVLGLGRELMKRGHGVEVICPMYAGMRYDLISDLHEEYGELWCPHYDEWRQEKVFQGKVEGGLQVNFITGGDYTERPSIYGYDDDLQRFTYFSRQALEFMYKTNRRPDIIHCHDWATGLVPAILWDVYQKLGWDNSRVVYTIHNNECQGLCGFGDKLLSLVGLNVKNYLMPDKMQDDTHRNCINMMKGGIVFSNFVTTVSPTYAGELKTAAGGRGLQTTIARNSAKVGGVLNGIDYDSWNPQTDGKLASRYSAGDDFNHKYDNKKALRDWLGLWDAWKPIVSVVTRLTHQKGLDLIKQAIFQVQEMQGQFVLLGSAPDPKVNADFLRMQHELKDNHDVNLYIGYHEDLSRLIYAGSDLFLIPSLYEPCGLTQMISLRYGTVPVVRETGGLVDTVFDLDNSGLGLKDANGFTFRDPTPLSLRYGLERAIRLWYDNPEAFNRLARNGMRYDYSWRHPAEHYENIYNYIKA